jgi:hypothetical protein
MLSLNRWSVCPITFIYRVRIYQVIVFIYRGPLWNAFINYRPFAGESKVGQNYNA